MRDVADAPAQVQAAPALGYSITANLGGDRQMVVQCFTDSDESLEATHAKIDRAFAVVDRQRARYEILDLKREQGKLADELAQGEQDLAEVDLNFEKAQASLDVQLADMAMRQKRVSDEAYEQHTVTGRRSAFKLVGHAKANYDHYAAAIAQVDEQKQKNEAERNQHRQAFLISQQRRRTRLAWIDEEVVRLEAVIG